MANDSKDRPEAEEFQEEDKPFKFPPLPIEDGSPASGESLSRLLKVAEGAGFTDKEDIAAIAKHPGALVSDMYRGLELLTKPPLLAMALRRRALYEMLANPCYEYEIATLYFCLSSSPLLDNLDKNLQLVRKDSRGVALDKNQLGIICQGLRSLKDAGFLDWPSAQRYVDAITRLDQEPYKWAERKVGFFKALEEACKRAQEKNNKPVVFWYTKYESINLSELVKFSCREDFFELFKQAPLAVDDAFALAKNWQIFGLLAEEHGRKNVQRLADERWGESISTLWWLMHDKCCRGDEDRLQDLSLLKAPEGQVLLDRIFAAYQKDPSVLFVAINIVSMLPKSSSPKIVQDCLARIFPSLSNDSKDTVSASPLDTKSAPSSLPKSPQEEKRAETLTILRAHPVLQNFPPGLVVSAPADLKPALIEGYVSPDTEEDEAELKKAQALVVEAGQDQEALKKHVQFAVCNNFPATLTFYLNRGVIEATGEFVEADNKTSTYLTLAVERGCVETARVLLQHVLSVPMLDQFKKKFWLNKRDSKKMNALAYAVQRPDREMVRALLACGAGVHVSVLASQKENGLDFLICFALEEYKNDPTVERKEILWMLLRNPFASGLRDWEQNDSKMAEYICSLFYPAAQLSVAANMTLGLQPVSSNASLDKKDADKPKDESAGPGCVVS